MQIDRIALENKNKRSKVLIKIGSFKIDQQYLKGNEKIIDYQEGKNCLQCGMIMDLSEKSPCKYCRGDFNE